MNNWFKFKLFTVHQQHNAMKVCTDSCLFGAWIANKKLSANNVLDIGTGTGLLSLQYAQKNDAHIDAVEIDEEAYNEACCNVLESPWCNKIEVHHANILQFNPNYGYDLIITNPPFYNNYLAANSAKKNTAMHSTSLNFRELVSCIKKNLLPHGVAAILLPLQAFSSFLLEIDKQFLFIQEQVEVSTKQGTNVFRFMLLIGHKKQEIVKQHIAIKNSENQYSDVFVEMLKGYYLYL